ncbi:hypothetical protein Agau_P200591 (plasmid) [Agrobacterium tumefaciens F2]|nr:hypothetical protein Agau_P200591 [Agrobacterium tumefaciens F2]
MDASGCRVNGWNCRKTSSMSTEALSLTDTRSEQQEQPCRHDFFN